MSVTAGLGHMRVIAVSLCLLVPSVAVAKPSRYPPVTQFAGDRYMSVAQLPKDVTTRVYRDRKARKGKRYPVPRPRPGFVAPLTLAGGFGHEVRRGAVTVLGGRPTGCPARFCGCGASLHVFGRIIPALNLAANWLRFPRVAPASGMVAARRGHVFVLKQHIAGNTWLVFDANSGGRRTRIHPRSIAGYAVVNPYGGRA